MLGITVGPFITGGKMKSITLTYVSSGPYMQFNRFNKERQQAWKINF